MRSAECGMRDSKFRTRTVQAVKPKGGSADDRLFESNCQELLKKKCYRCHSEKTRKGGLDLSTPAGILRGSESGRIVVPDKPEESLLYEMVSEGLMPPQEKDRLSQQQIETIRKWIAAGARFRSGAVAARLVNQHDLIPLLGLRCTVCHGLRRREAELDLRTKSAMLKGGKSGPAIVPGKPDESLILKRIRAGEMPPPDRLVEVGVKTMPPQEIELLTRWIELGTPDPQIAPDVATTDPDPLVSDQDRKFWSFQPPQMPKVPHPTVENAADKVGWNRVRNPIDAFVLRLLKAAGLSFSPQADRLTLLRRASFDLTGLPAEPDEVELFLADTLPGAYERLIDRLLASPRYGERWGRHWLDLAGYADSEGKREQDVLRPSAYRYRDYVVRAWNADKPYDRFLTEQLAGDELVDYGQAEVITQEIYDNLVATGFLRMAPDATLARITNFVPNRLEVIADAFEIFGSTVLGLTLQCARCHSHKFDPIPQRDYYRLRSTFKGALDEHDWLKPQQAGLRQGVPADQQRQLGYVTTAERQQWLEQQQHLDVQIKPLKQKLQQREKTLKKKYLEKRLKTLPAVLYNDLRAMLATTASERSAVQKYLASKFEKTLQLDNAALKKIDAGFKKLSEETEQRIEKIESHRKPEPQIRALWDRGDPSPTYILRRGNSLTPGRLVGPGVPSVLTDGQTPFIVKPPWPGARKTGRRLALVRWLTRPNHPLTARVMVNRIWARHFNAGIVATLANFGKNGARPTHPELLDWLALEFVRGGWSVKAMHRLMMASATYRQSSQLTPAHENLDPENRLFSRAPLRRMEAEVLRDSLLFISARLEERPFGPPDKVNVRADGLVTSAGTERGWRRSLYVQHRRKQLPTLLETFDLPQMNPNCIDRADSTVATQALLLLNNRMVRELADTFAERVIAEVGSEPDRQIAQVYQVALGRPPNRTERRLSSETLARLTAEWTSRLASQLQQNNNKTNATQPQAAERGLGNFCHAVMNSAAFLYID